MLCSYKINERMNPDCDIVDQYMIFMNPFCAFDNGYNISDTTNVCVDRKETVAIQEIWNFRSAGKPSEEITCPLGKIVDDVSQTCRQIMCDIGYSLQGEKCISKNKTEAIVDTWICTEKSIILSLEVIYHLYPVLPKKLWADYEPRGSVQVFYHQASPDREDVLVAIKDVVTNTSENLASIKNLIKNQSFCGLEIIEVLSFLYKNIRNM